MRAYRRAGGVRVDRGVSRERAGGDAVDLGGHRAAGRGMVAWLEGAIANATRPRSRKRRAKHRSGGRRRGPGVDSAAASRPRGKRPVDGRGGGRSCRRCRLFQPHPNRPLPLCF